MHHIQNIQPSIRSIGFQEVIEPIGFIALGILQMWKHFFGVSSVNFGIITLISCVTLFSYNVFTREDDIYDCSVVLKQTLVKVIICGIIAYGVNLLRETSSCSLASASLLTICQSVIIMLKSFLGLLMQEVNKVKQQANELNKLNKLNQEITQDLQTLDPNCSGSVLQIVQIEKKIQARDDLYQKLKSMLEDASDTEKIFDAQRQFIEKYKSDMDERGNEKIRSILHR